MLGENEIWAIASGRNRVAASAGRPGPARYHSAVLLRHRGKDPVVHRSAYVAPTAVVCGEVTVGERSRILFGAVIVAEGGPVEIGAECIVMELALIRGTRPHPTRLGSHVLVGPHAYLSGCSLADNVFVASGARVFNGARLGERSEVRVNGTVHIRTVLPPDFVVPIGWVAIGDPAEAFPPQDHDDIAGRLRELNFPRTVFGVQKGPEELSVMPELTRRYARALAAHEADTPLPESAGEHGDL